MLKFIFVDKLYKLASACLLYFLSILIKSVPVGFVLVLFSI